MEVGLETKHSTISGIGSFARRNFLPGEFICTLTGSSYASLAIAMTECIKRHLSSEDLLQVGDEEFMILDYESKVINHSCEPNAALRNKCDLYALRSIAYGEEITFDYACTVGVDNEYHLDCCCRAHHCRKHIGNVLSIPSSQLDFYINNQGLQTFVYTQLKRIGYIE